MTGTVDREFDEQFDELRALGYRAAYRLLGSAAESEDVADEALCRAYSRWRSVSGHARPWVVTVSTNLALDRARRRRTAELSAPRLVASGRRPDPYVEQRLDLQHALRRLPRRQREVVALRYLADWSERRTAEELGIGVGTVKSHTSRALASLRLLVATED